MASILTEQQRQGEVLQHIEKRQVLLLTQNHHEVMDLDDDMMALPYHSFEELQVLNENIPYPMPYPQMANARERSGKNKRSAIYGTSFLYFYQILLLILVEMG